jgi:hypothetical protein
MPKSQQPDEGQNILVDLILRSPDRVVLDVGAGSGKWGRLLFRKVKKIIALEVWKPHVVDDKLAQVYDEIVVGDVRNFVRWDEVDAIILGDVLEHLCREDALALVETVKSRGIAAYLTVPISECAQDGAVYGNPFETHLDQWSHEELTAIGWRQVHVGANEQGTVTVGTYVMDYFSHVDYPRQSVKGVSDVTVVIPCSGGHYRYVEDAIRSCFSAEPAPDAVVVVDDAGDTTLVPDRVAPATLVTMPRHVGRSKARNAGVATAATAWLFFLDADDRLLSTAVRDFRILLQRRPATLYWADYRYVGLDGRSHVARQRGLAKDRVALWNASNIGMFVRRDRFAAVGGFDEDMSFGEYRDLFNKLVINPRVPIHKACEPFFEARAQSSVSPDATRLIEQAMLKIRAMCVGGYYNQWVKT